MLQLENRDLRVDLLDPANPADVARQGWRYCWGGYIWQVTDHQRGPLLSGPEFPKADPSTFNGQGLPESFRHTRRDTQTRLTWTGDTGLALGAGTLAANPDPSAPVSESVRVIAPCSWQIAATPDHYIFQTQQTAAGFSSELTRRIELRDRTISSYSWLTNRGATPLTLQWFPHPFWALTAGRARITLPAGTTIPENPGFAVAADGVLTFKRPFVAAGDSQFALLSLPSGRELTLAIDHPQLARITFATSFTPDECPVWANAHTISVEPYLNLSLAPGETRAWHVRHGFEA
jgi:hypothetical protein